MNRKSISEYTAILLTALKAARDAEKLETSKEGKEEWRRLIRECRKELYAIDKGLIPDV